MLLTRDGRFNSGTFYTEAQSFSQDNAYNNALLTQIKNALKTNFNIDESLLTKLESRYMSNGQLPKDVIAKYVKKATPPAAQQAAGAGQNPKAAGAQDAIAQTQPNPLEEYAKQEQNKQTKTIQEIQQLNYTPIGTDNILLGAGGTVDINNQNYLISVYYPNFKQIDKLINLKSYYPATFIFPDNLVDLIKSGKIKSISPAVIIRYDKQHIATVIKGTFNT